MATLSIGDRANLLDDKYQGLITCFARSEQGEALAIVLQYLVDGFTWPPEQYAIDAHELLDGVPIPEGKMVSLPYNILAPENVSSKYDFLTQTLRCRPFGQKPVHIDVISTNGCSVIDFSECGHGPAQKRTYEVRGLVEVEIVTGNGAIAFSDLDAGTLITCLNGDAAGVVLAVDDCRALCIPLSIVFRERKLTLMNQDDPLVAKSRRSAKDISRNVANGLAHTQRRLDAAKKDREMA